MISHSHPIFFSSTDIENESSFTATGIRCSCFGNFSQCKGKDVRFSLGHEDSALKKQVPAEEDLQSFTTKHRYYKQRYQYPRYYQTYSSGYRYPQYYTNQYNYRPAYRPAYQPQYYYGSYYSGGDYGSDGDSGGGGDGGGGGGGD